MFVRYRLTKIRITHSIFIYEILFMHDVTAKGRWFAANGRLLFYMDERYLRNVSICLKLS